MPEVIALCSFEHGSSRRRGERFDVSDNHAAALLRAGLVEVVGDHPPAKAAGGKSSASQAAQASPEQTLSRSARGAKSKPAAQ